MSENDTQKAEMAQILVVDDTPVNLKLLMVVLTGQGYRVRPASNGRMALRSVAVEEPDLILLDVKMPEMDGYEVCRRLKSDEKSRNIPVIFISALDEVAEKVKGFKAGGVDYIVKPFEPTEVLARVETHLALRRLQKQLEAQNIQLQEEITARRQTEEDLESHKARLEELIDERTSDLKKVNEELQREITERRQAEEAFRDVIHKAPIGIFVLQNRKFKLANPYFEKTAGYSENELIGKDPLFLVAPEFRETVRDKATRMLKGEDTCPYEYQLADKNGGIHWVMERVTSTLYGGEKMTLGFFMDVTARKKAEETFKASKSRFQKILEQPDPS